MSLQHFAIASKKSILQKMFNPYSSIGIVTVVLPRRKEYGDYEIVKKTIEARGLHARRHRRIPFG